MVDVGPLWLGYDGCAAVTIIAGRNPFWEKMLEAVEQAISEALGRLKLGVPVRSLDAVARAVLGEKASPKLSSPFGTLYRRLLQARSSGVYTYMIWRKEWCLLCGPAVYLPGRGGVRIEPHIAVTEGGYKVLTDIHRGLTMS